MYKVISSSPHSYVGCSRKLAFEFARACRAVGACFLIRHRRSFGEWRDVAEHVA
jgi:hypothetical protein